MIRCGGVAYAVLWLLLSNAAPAASAVPGEVHWDLERAGKIEPICCGLNSQKIDWVAGKEWWYRKTFRLPSEWQGKIVRLQFDGVDYLADVWLNGRHLGRHEGQFTPFEFDATTNLRHDGENVLVVQIHPAPESMRKMVGRGRSPRRRASAELFIPQITMCWTASQ